MARTVRLESLFPRLPGLLAYPLRTPLPWMIAGVCALRLLSYLPNLAGLLFEIAFWLMALKLAVEALTNTAQGRYDPISGAEMLATDGDAFGQLLLQAGTTALLLVALSWSGFGLFLWLAAAALLFLPAATIFLAIDGSLLGALNPLAWFRLIGRLGGAYFEVVVVLGLLHGASWLLQAGIGTAMPGALALLASGAVAVYALLAGYHVLGDLVCRHHAALGVDLEPTRARPQLDSPEEDQAMSEAEAMAREGRAADAAECLRQLFRGRGASDAVHDRHRQYLIAAGKIADLSKHDDEYIARLLVTGNDRRALAVAVETRALDAGFLPGRAEDVARLVVQAVRGGLAREAAGLADGFEQRFPGNVEGVRVVLETATVLADRVGREDDAARRLKTALAAFPEHPLAPALRDALVHVERVRAITAGR